MMDAFDFDALPSSIDAKQYSNWRKYSDSLSVDAAGLGAFQHCSVPPKVY